LDFEAWRGVPGLLQPDFMGYLEQFTDTPATVGGQEVESRIRRPFLKRTMITTAAAAGPPEDRELTIMNGTQMRNGLECKLTTLTSKVPILRSSSFHAHAFIGSGGVCDGEGGTHSWWT
jgi:hypothetical protein